MEVYVIYYDYGYDGYSEPIAVLSDHEKALEVQKRLDRKAFGYDVVISSFHLDQIPHKEYSR